MSHFAVLLYCEAESVSNSLLCCVAALTDIYLNARFVVLPRIQLFHHQVFPKHQGNFQAESPPAPDAQQHGRREGHPGDCQSEAEAWSDQSDVPHSPPTSQTGGDSDRRAESTQFPIIVFCLFCVSTSLRFTVTRSIISLLSEPISLEDMSDTETQTSGYCTAPSTQNPREPSPEAGDDSNVTAERGKSDGFGLFENLPGNVTLTKFLPAAVETNMLSFITGKDSLEQQQE